MTGEPVGSAGPAPGWRLPRPVLLRATGLGLLLLVPLVAAYLLAGPAAALIVGLSYSAIVPAAVSLNTRTALGVSLLSAVIAVVAAGTGGDPLPAACLVALVVVFTIPGSLHANAALVGIPTMVAVLVSLPVPVDPAQAGLWTLLGGAGVVVLLAGQPRPPVAATTGPRASLLHGVVSAVAVGGLIWVVLAFQVPHGYWVAMTLTLVLRRVSVETWLVARRRVIGTLVGAVVAVGVAGWLPLWAILVVLTVLLVLLIGYAVTGNYLLQVACMTPMIILLGSTGSAAVVVAGERILATIAGAMAAGLVGWLVLWLEDRGPVDAPPPNPPGLAL